MFKLVDNQGNVIENKFSWNFYKEVEKVAPDPETNGFTKFDNLISLLGADNADSLVYVGTALANGKLTNEQVADQLSSQGVFESDKSVSKNIDEVLNGFKDSGFLMKKVRETFKSLDDVVDTFKELLKEIQKSINSKQAFSKLSQEEQEAYHNQERYLKNQINDLQKLINKTKKRLSIQMVTPVKKVTKATTVTKKTTAK